MFSENLKNYFQMLDKLPLLSREEEILLFTEVERCKERFIRSSVRYKSFREILSQLLMKVSNSKLLEGNAAKPLFILKDFSSRDVGEYSRKLQEVAGLILSTTSEERIKAFRKLHISGNLFYSLMQKLEQAKKLQDKKLRLQELGELLKQPDPRKLFRLPKGASGRRGIYTEIRDLTRSYPKFKTKKVSPSLIKVNALREGYLQSVETLRDNIIEGNLRLVVARAKYQRGKGLEFSDLIQSGNLGLMRAVDKYDVSQNVKFSTLATWWIDLALKRAVANQARTIKIPSRIQDLMFKIGYLKLLPIPRIWTVETLAKHLEVSEEDVTLALDSKLLNLMPAGGEAGQTDSGDKPNTFLSQIPSETLSPLQNLEDTSTCNAVRNALQGLDPLGTKIICMLYGIVL